MNLKGMLGDPGKYLLYVILIIHVGTYIDFDRL